jgi:CheY-like chemotaxis protein
MTELFRQLFELLKRHFSSEVVGLIVLCCCAIYIWYQHLRLKLLRERIDLDDKNRDSIRQIARTLNERDHTQARSYTDNPLERILVVDDEEMAVEIVEELIRITLPTAQVVKAYDGEEALESIRQHIPSLLITGIIMPRMTGLELLKQLHQENREVPTIIISGFLTNDVMITIRNMQLATAIEIIAFRKPFNPDEVIRAIKQLMHRTT